MNGNCDVLRALGVSIYVVFRPSVLPTSDFSHSSGKPPTPALPSSTSSGIEDPLGLGRAGTHPAALQRPGSRLGSSGSGQSKAVTHLVRQEPCWAGETAHLGPGGGAGGLLRCPAGSGDQPHQVVGDDGRLQSGLRERRGTGTLRGADRRQDRRRWSSGLGWTLRKQSTAGL